MLPKKKIYLDYNATTPVDQKVLEVMMPYFTENFGNASSDHVFGWDANEAVELAREQIASLINVKSKNITFTSGATEATNLALLGFCQANKAKGNHIISCRTEHKAMLDTLNALERSGLQVTYLEVDSDGNIDLQDLEESIKEETILVSLMLANNETGLIHPFQEIERIVHAKGAKLMSDITQAIGKIPVDLEKLNIDLAVFSSHKIYGPKGVGALYINKKNNIEVDATFFGGGQERGLRPGTLNVPGIVGFGKAAEIVKENLDVEAIRLSGLRDSLEAHLSKIDGIQINSKNSRRLPNTTNILFRNIDGFALLRKLNNLAISRGSACTSNIIDPSHVLKAMKIDDDTALASFRFSLGRNTTQEDIGIAAQEILDAVNQLSRAEV